MSNIKLVHSGGNSVSLTTPTSNPSSNITFKLPQSDGTAGQVLMTDGNGNLSWVTPATTNGITMAQQWRVTADFTVSAGSDSTIASNWESADTHGPGAIGSNLTESSGVFSFPSTGIYRIYAQTTYNSVSGANYRTELKMQVQTASDNNWQLATSQGQSLSSPAEQTGSISMEYLFDVTNTSSCIFKLLVRSHENSIKFHGASDKTETGITVIRLGDT